MKSNLIDTKYLPLTPQELEPHFISKAEEHISYFQKSAERYHSFIKAYEKLEGIPITESKYPRQIEKDERIWTVTALKALYDDKNRVEYFIRFLSSYFGNKPPINDFSTWDQCFEGGLRLYFEANLPSPKSYKEWLRLNINNRHIIPYVLDATARSNNRALEGPTHVDALLINPVNGFSVLFEAKVLSDISYMVSFDMQRNQLVRNIDVMLDANPDLENPLNCRNPDRSLFVLLTPGVFKESPHSRLYGFLFNEYRNNPDSLARDLSHRIDVDWAFVCKRIGWLTFEDINQIKPDACSWLSKYKEGA